MLGTLRRRLAERWGEIPEGDQRILLGRRLAAPGVERGGGHAGRRCTTRSPPSEGDLERGRPGRDRRPRLRRRLERRRDRRRLDPHQRRRRAGARPRPARHRRGRGGGALRLPARGAALRRSAARRHRLRRRPDLRPRCRGRLDPRRDRLPEDGLRRRSADRRSGAGRRAPAARARGHRPAPPTGPVTDADRGELASAVVDRDQLPRSRAACRASCIATSRCAPAAASDPARTRRSRWADKSYDHLDRRYAVAVIRPSGDRILLARRRRIRLAGERSRRRQRADRARRWSSTGTCSGSLRVARRSRGRPGRLRILIAVRRPPRPGAQGFRPIGRSCVVASPWVRVRTTAVLSVNQHDWLGSRCPVGPWACRQIPPCISGFISRAAPANWSP